MSCLKVINIRLSDELEARIRKFTSRKGDLSKLACEALGMLLAEHEPKLLVNAIVAQPGAVEVGQ